MTLSTLRKKALAYVESADESKLKIIYSLMKQIDEKEAGSLKKYSLEEYNESLTKAEEEIAEGKYVSQKEAVKQILKWK